MPEVLRGKYQYFTQASLTKLRAAGNSHECCSLESAVADYVKQYLTPGRLVADA
jgi:ADP-L-glycero-D-manno-heptose 6-epimerase